LGVDKPPTLWYNKGTKRKELITMKNFLFEDFESGERFFVQADSYGDALEILMENDFSPANCQYIDNFTDEEAELFGYDTY
jgi:hypothetical protein